MEKNEKIIKTMLILLFSIAIIGVLYVSFFKKFYDDSDEVINLKIDKAILEERIRYTDSMIAIENASVEKAVKDYKSISTKDEINKISVKYESKKNDIVNMPIDSIVRNLSRWVSQKDEGKQ